MESYLQKSWKPNLESARKNHFDWWNQKGLVLNRWGSGFPCDCPISADIPKPEEPASPELQNTDPDYVSANIEYELSRNRFAADVLPIAPAGHGTVELAAYLGAELSFQKNMVWYNHVIKDPDTWPELRFDPENKWFRRMEETLRKCVERADGRYMIGMPAIPPNLDVLAELRGTQELLMDFFDRPDWVKKKLDEIDEVYFEVYDRMYDIIKQPDGSSCFYYFMLHAPGKVTLLQGDVTAMISEDTFREFMAPGVKKVAERIDYSMFHVDGPGMVQHVDALCEIEALNAIQFTAGPAVPTGGDPHWYDMYRKILAAGKSVQVVPEPHEVLPLLDAIGTEGVHLLIHYKTADEMIALENQIRG